MASIETETYDFPTMRAKNRIYVDKTGDFHRLITGDAMFYFVSRPRRFGKSLMISTLDSIFRGRKERSKVTEGRGTVLRQGAHGGTKRGWRSAGCAR